MSVDLSHLNAEQRQAVRHQTGPLLVLAGAGSGKTRVVTYRTARLVSDGIDPERILVVTFTNKAAAEMRGRIWELVGRESGRGLSLSTFHAFGLRLLRSHIGRLGYRRSFTLVDTADQLRVVKSALAELGRQRSSARPQEILSFISRAKRARTTPAGLRGQRFTPVLPLAQRVFESYQTHLRALGAVDFDDLLVLPLELCDAHEHVREWLAARFDFVMVDEYQDTNPIQLELLQRVAPHGNLMAVGDDDQSIYAFQGALADNILDFERHFRGAKVVKLEQNYRSTNRILAAANGVIAQNRARHVKKLWSERGVGSKIRYQTCSDEREEAAFVADDIVRTHTETGVAHESMAVLYRLNAQALLFEEAFQIRKVPYRVVGSTELFERAEVRDWLAYLRVVVNPRDELSFRRIVNIPRRGLGPAAVGLLEAAAERQGGSWVRALRDPDGLAQLSARGRRGAAELAALLETHREALLAARGGELAVAAQAFLEASGLPAHMITAEKSPDAAARRIDTVRQLVRGMTEVAGRLSDYLAAMTLEARAPEPQDARPRGVTLLTLHSAKGLEFPHVYLVGFERDLLPHRRSLDSSTGIAEERRLCYVGMTRAMDRLTLTAARTRTRRGEKLPRQPSPFLEEIPPELLEREAEREAVESSRRARTRAYVAHVLEMLESGKER